MLSNAISDSVELVEVLSGPACFGSPFYVTRVRTHTNVHSRDGKACTHFLDFTQLGTEP